MAYLLLFLKFILKAYLFNIYYLLGKKEKYIEWVHWKYELPI